LFQNSPLGITGLDRIARYCEVGFINPQACVKLTEVELPW